MDYRSRPHTGNDRPAADIARLHDVDGGPPDASAKTVYGTVSGGRLITSTNYRLRLTIGGSPMARTASTNYHATLGMGAKVNQ